MWRLNFPVAGLTVMMLRPVKMTSGCQGTSRKYSRMHHRVVISEGPVCRVVDGVSEGLKRVNFQ
jgi:hypothetical protein